jgi:hypothetical protein
MSVPFALWVSALRTHRGGPIKRSGNCCGARSLNKTVNTAPCRAVVARTSLHLDHIWRGSLLAAIGWSPSAIDNPISLQLLCRVHHADKTAHEAQLLAADQAMSAPEN